MHEEIGNQDQDQKCHQHQQCILLGRSVVLLHGTDAVRDGEEMLEKLFVVVMDREELLVQTDHLADQLPAGSDQRQELAHFCRIGGLGPGRILAHRYDVGLDTLLDRAEGTVDLPAGAVVDRPLQNTGGVVGDTIVLPSPGTVGGNVSPPFPGAIVADIPD